MTLGPPKKSLQFLVIGRLQNWCGDTYIFCQPVKYVIHVYMVIGTRPNCPIHKVWWLRDTSQIGQTFIPLCKKKSFKIQHGRIPINPAVLAATGHRFYSNNKNQKIKNADARVWGDGHRDQKLETCCFALNPKVPKHCYWTIQIQQNPTTAFVV